MIIASNDTTLIMHFKFGQYSLRRNIIYLKTLCQLSSINSLHGNALLQFFKILHNNFFFKIFDKPYSIPLGR